MRARRLWWLLLVSIALRAPAAPENARRVSVDQLEHLLTSAESKGDEWTGRQLAGLELTERLSAARFTQLKSELPGEKSQRALLALADVSSFLPPPAEEIPATAAPDQASQRRMMARTVDYLAKTLPLLPNLFATRDTLHFETRASQLDADFSGANPLRAVSRSAATVFYRGGQEFVDAGTTKDAKAKTPDAGLTTWGEFGPILSTIVIDAAQSKLEWSHWELSGGAPQGVFRYAVPTQKSHYNLRFCCVTGAYGLEVKLYTQRMGYHGEITVDPDSGAILRLTAIGDFEAGNPIARALVLVEYGPEEIGGKTYICPVHGIAIAQAPDQKGLSSSLAALRNAEVVNGQIHVEKASVTTVADEPRQVLLNDVVFRQYHLFRSESRLLTEKETEAAVRAAPAVPVPAVAAESAKPGEETFEAEPVAAKPTEEMAAAALPTPVASPVIPEIYVAAASGLPDAPALQTGGGTNAGATYRINARLVDVSLVALDKKGRPLTNVSPDQLEVYDNGTKVDMRSFQQTGTAAAIAQPAATSPQPSNGESEAEFSNRGGAAGKGAPSDLQNTIILLLDNTLSFDDLQNAREQMGTFLRGLHENERAAIYVMHATGFQVLQDPTTDHPLAAKTLASWTPSADNIARGQEQEARNRQQMEYVHNTEDLLAVNGNGLMENQSQTQAQDPKLREMGDNPGRDALWNLVLLARHLASVPGHKSLVWIASDNVLADWNHSSLNIEKGSRNIEPIALRAQEAMNEAHVSVYPLDSSRLEAGGLDASIAEPNVLLNPTATANQMSGGASQSASGCGLVSNGGGTPSGGTVAGGGPEVDSGADIDTCGKTVKAGRLTAQMQQDLHSIQGVYREIADATGGRPFRRASDMVAELNTVAADGRATYLLSFAPPEAADGKYHLITIKLIGRKDVTLRYRTGYFYQQEAVTLKDRFREAVLQPEDKTEIGLKASLVAEAKDKTVKLAIATTDLAMAQADSFWADKLDVFVVQREMSGMKAHISGQSMSLHLLPGSYQKYLREGIPYRQVLEVAPETGSVRIIVVDENSGRMGSVTIPGAALGRT